MQGIEPRSESSFSFHVSTSIMEEAWHLQSPARQGPKHMKAYSMGRTDMGPLLLSSSEMSAWLLGSNMGFPPCLILSLFSVRRIPRIIDFSSTNRSSVAGLI